MFRYLAGAAAALLLVTGAVLMWQSRAAEAPGFPTAPAPRAFTTSLVSQDAPLRAPEASPKSREEKRFSRADKDKNGQIESEELLGPRRKAFAKLDANANGALSFEEWAVKTVRKFRDADRDRNGWLSAAEYATTAPPPPKHKSCSCARAEPSSNDD